VTPRHEMSGVNEKRKEKKKIQTQTHTATMSGVRSRRDGGLVNPELLVPISRCGKRATCLLASPPINQDPSTLAPRILIAHHPPFAAHKRLQGNGRQGAGRACVKVGKQSPCSRLPREPNSHGFISLEALSIPAVSVSQCAHVFSLWDQYTNIRCILIIPASCQLYTHRHAWQSQFPERARRGR
jgi:hypothetical protein